MAWNPLVPPERRFETTKMNPGRPLPKPTHLVLHITGDNTFENVKNAFLTQPRSAHYLVDKAGLVYQFVREEDQAWHAGIPSHVQALYDQPNDKWRKYLLYFNWYQGYPANSVYCDKKLAPKHAKAGAAFVRRQDSKDWADYDYFTARWGAGAGPLNYATSKRPNAYSVGIEILTTGAKTPSAVSYTPEMYAGLQALVTDICDRQGIPRARGNVVGHEDVTPVQRWGWDPNQGFDWSKVWA